MFNRTRIDRGGDQVFPQGPGDALLTMTKVASITTVGAGTLTAAAMLAGIVDRTGPTGNYIDTLDTADNLIAAMPWASPGDSFEFLYRNTVAYTATPAVAEGAELSGSNTALAVSSARKFLVTIYSNRRRTVIPMTTTSSSATISGMTQSQAERLQPGMGASGTGIQSGSTVLSVNPAAGTAVLSLTASASGTNVAVSFFPRYDIKGLYNVAAL